MIQTLDISFEDETSSSSVDFIDGFIFLASSCENLTSSDMEFSGHSFSWVKPRRSLRSAIKKASAAFNIKSSRKRKYSGLPCIGKSNSVQNVISKSLVNEICFPDELVELLYQDHLPSPKRKKLCKYFEKSVDSSDEILPAMVNQLKKLAKIEPCESSKISRNDTNQSDIITKPIKIIKNLSIPLGSKALHNIYKDLVSLSKHCYRCISSFLFLPIPMEEARVINCIDFPVKDSRLAMVDPIAPCEEEIEFPLVQPDLDPFIFE